MPLYRAYPMRIAVREAATGNAPTAPGHGRPIQRAAACLAALGRPSRQTSTLFVRHRLRNEQTRQTKKSTLPASERGCRPAFTVRGGDLDTVLVNVQTDVQSARFLHGPSPRKFATTRPTIGWVHWCSSARPRRATYVVARDGPPRNTKPSWLGLTRTAGCAPTINGEYEATNELRSCYAKECLYPGQNASMAWARSSARGTQRG